jgi:hypothetical protein
MVRISAILLGVFTLSAVVCAAASGPDPVETVRRFREAKESGDLAESRSFLAPDARIWFDMEQRKGPGKPWTLEPGPWEAWDRYFHSHTDLRDWKHDAGRVTAVGHETNDFYRLLDWKPKPLLLTWWLNPAGKITGFMFHAIPGAPPAQNRLKEFEAWAKKARPAELSYLMPDGRIDPSADRPARWRDILVEWRKAAGLPEVSLPKALPPRLAPAAPGDPAR